MIHMILIATGFDTILNLDMNKYSTFADIHRYESEVEEH